MGDLIKVLAALRTGMPVTAIVIKPILRVNGMLGCRKRRRIVGKLRGAGCACIYGCTRKGRVTRANRLVEGLGAVGHAAVQARGQHTACQLLCRDGSSARRAKTAGVQIVAVDECTLVIIIRYDRSREIRVHAELSCKIAVLDHARALARKSAAIMSTRDGRRAVAVFDSAPVTRRCHEAGRVILKFRAKVAILDAKVADRDITYVTKQSVFVVRTVNVDVYVTREKAAQHVAVAIKSAAIRQIVDRCPECKRRGVGHKRAVGLQHLVVEREICRQHGADRIVTARDLGGIPIQVADAFYGVKADMRLVKALEARKVALGDLGRRHGGGIDCRRGGQAREPQHHRAKQRDDQGGAKKMNVFSRFHKCSSLGWGIE